MQVVSTTASAGTQVFVSVDLTALGNEAATQFSVNFNPSIVSISNLSSPNLNPDVTIGTGVPAGSAITVNGSQALFGRIGVLVDSAGTFVSSPPARQVVTLRFTVSPTAPSVSTPITFVDAPIGRSTSDFLGNSLATAYVDGVITIQNGGSE
ncbi:MAG: hypothetical protein IPG58_15680 [Acidobacteria bacterium]|nr:hypothetical protein [Acidobacteriota bacterium]